MPENPTKEQQVEKLTALLVDIVGKLKEVPVETREEWVRSNHPNGQARVDEILEMAENGRNH